MKRFKVRSVCASFLLVALAACACTQKRVQPPASDDVRVHVGSVGFDRTSSAHYVLLEDDSRGRALPILIGESEAQVIALELHGIKPPRPLTLDLLKNILHTTGNRVDRVVVYDVRDGVYYARILLDGGRYVVDARPSDAIALAQASHAPIYVKAKLLRPRSALALGPFQSLPRTARGLGLTVQEITPAIAKYFNIEPGTGLLVSASAGAAHAAGIRPGDIVTAVAGKAVKQLPDFDRALSVLREGEDITLTVRRDGSQHSVTLKASSPKS